MYKISYRSSVEEFENFETMKREALMKIDVQFLLLCECLGLATGTNGVGGCGGVGIFTPCETRSSIAALKPLECKKS